MATLTVNIKDANTEWKRFPAAFKQAVVNEYNDNRVTQQQLAVKYGLCRSTINKWIKASQQKAHMRLANNSEPITHAIQEIDLVEQYEEKFIFEINAQICKTVDKVAAVIYKDGFFKQDKDGLKDTKEVIRDILYNSIIEGLDYGGISKRRNINAMDRLKQLMKEHEVQDKIHKLEAQRRS